jgi:hypothetical protein
MLTQQEQLVQSLQEQLLQPQGAMLTVVEGDWVWELVFGGWFCPVNLSVLEELGEQMEWLAGEGTPSFIDLAALRDLIDRRQFPSQLPL